MSEITDEQREELKKFAGQDAINFAYRKGNEWVCVCGTFNTIDENRNVQNCSHCHRNRDFTLQQYGKPGENIKIQTCVKKKSTHKNKYLLIQFSILIFPPLLATIMLEINNYIKDPFTEFLGYIFGISGLITIGFLFEFLGSLLTESIASLICICIYFIIAYWLFIKFYDGSEKRTVTVSIINLYLSVWSVLFGVFWMFAAMQ